MASQTQGIQQLLIAEKRAAEKVSEARKRKQKRLKQAKEEAQAEIELYRQERENQFKEFERNFIGSRESDEIHKETILKIDGTTRSAESKKEAVIHDILSMVYDINPEVHKNYLLRLKNL